VAKGAPDLLLAAQIVGKGRELPRGAELLDTALIIGKTD